MSKHTQGEWVATDGNETGMIVVAPDQPKVRYRVAACGGPNREANARLISAAPDLLEALKQCAAVCSGDSMSKSSLIAALTAARTAISKAEGQ